MAARRFPTGRDGGVAWMVGISSAYLVIGVAALGLGEARAVPGLARPVLTPWSAAPSVREAPRCTNCGRIVFRMASVRQRSQVGGGQSRLSQHAHASMARPQDVHLRIPAEGLLTRFCFRQPGPRQFAEAGRPACRQTW